ncbi:MAG: hypothetical protein IT285_09865 [Bdellovibrionales bacterium]|nr:hypothetical protein [Bdellovibrionales bacterium]
MTPMRMFENLMATLLIAAAGTASANPVLSQLTAVSGPAIPVEEIRLTGLRAYAGRTLSVFYVSARSTLATTGYVIRVQSLRKPPVKLRVDSAGRATIPATSVQQRGHWRAFNFLVFAVHRPDQQDVYLRNMDGTTPYDDARLGANMGDDRTGILPSLENVRSEDIGAERTAFLSLPRFKSLLREQKGVNPSQSWLNLDINSVGR